MPTAKCRQLYKRSLPRGMIHRMARTIVIRFPADRDRGFYFRVYLWADDTLYAAVDGEGVGTIVDLDRVRDVVRIELKRNRALKPTLKLIRETLPVHFGDCQPVVEVE
jgi:hypothetical protein